MSRWTEIETSPRFFEVDSYRIVNNMFYISWFEMGRFAVAEKAGLVVPRFEEEGLGFVVTRTEITYRKPVVFSMRVLIGTRIFMNEASRLVFQHRISSVKTRMVCAEGTTEVACIKGGKLLVKLPPWVQDCLNTYIKDVQGGLPKESVQEA